jgi:hypothetical protein
MSKMGLDEHIKHAKKWLPLTWQTLAGRRASLPADLAEQYVRQDSDQEDALVHWSDYRVQLLDGKYSEKENPWLAAASLGAWLRYGAQALLFGAGNGGGVSEYCLVA